MEGDPFAILEGMTIAALAVGAQKRLHPTSAANIRWRPLNGCGTPSHEARAHGLLGDNIPGRRLSASTSSCARGAGAYICGEETALFNSIEGYRGEPRNKPPFPTECRSTCSDSRPLSEQRRDAHPIFRKSFAAAALPLRGHRAQEIRGIPSVLCLSGHVVRPGVYEVPFGVTLRMMIDLAGGFGGSGRLQAVLLGGAAGAFVTPDELSTRRSRSKAQRAIGATLGSGVIMLFDDTVNLKQILLRIATFFRKESCGQCVPCRVGAIRQQEAIERLIEGRPLNSAAEEIVTLREMGQAMRDASICGLGQTASSALESALHRWSLFP